MTRREREPLTPEEREMALRLSRLESGAAPSASLDARILESARGGGVASTPTPASPTRPRRRWPVAMGLAASLLVAVGVAWQLRPQPDMQVLEAPSETARAATTEPMQVEPPAPAPAGAGPAPVAALPDQAPDTTDAPTQAAGNRVAVEPREGATAGPGADDREQAVLQAREAAARASVAGEARAAEDAALQAARARAAQVREAAPPPLAAPAPEEPARAAAASSPAPAASAARVADQPALAPAPSPPSPPAPPTPRATVPVATGAQASGETVDGRARQSASPALERVEVSGSRVTPPAAAEVDVLADQPLDEQPPASADSPAVRESWLQRIRELRDDGRLDEARDSLREFVRRHPQAQVPADLRPLLEE